MLVTLLHCCADLVCYKVNNFWAMNSTPSFDVQEWPRFIHAWSQAQMTHASSQAQIPTEFICWVTPSLICTIGGSEAAHYPSIPGSIRSIWQHWGVPINWATIQKAMATHRTYKCLDNPVRDMLHPEMDTQQQFWNLIHLISLWSGMRSSVHLFLSPLGHELQLKQKCYCNKSNCRLNCWWAVCP